MKVTWGWHFPRPSLLFGASLYSPMQGGRSLAIYLGPGFVRFTKDAR